MPDDAEPRSIEELRTHAASCRSLANSSCIAGAVMALLQIAEDFELEADRREALEAGRQV